MRFFRTMLMLSFLIGVGLTQALSAPIQPPAPSFPDNEQTPPSAVAAPTLKWAYGGCTASSCQQNGFYGSPAVVDLDNDGQPEIIHGFSDLVILNGANGTVKHRASDTSRVWTSVAVADLTGDGSLEIVVARDDDKLTVYNATGGTIWTRNPFNDPAIELTALALEDVNNNGTLEIIVGRGGLEEVRQLNVLDANGNQLPGWPARRSTDPGFGTGMYNQNLAVGDIDQDGTIEIINPIDKPYINAFKGNGDQLTVSPSFSPRQFWSQIPAYEKANLEFTEFGRCTPERRPNFALISPAIADMDADGTREIVLLDDTYDCQIGEIVGDLYIVPRILNIDRTRWSGSGFDWTVLPTPEPNSAPLSQNADIINISLASVVPADLDGDGQKEILFPSYDGRMHAYWLDKTQRGAWPYRIPGVGIRFAGEPVVADLDNNGTAEVIFTSWPERVDGRNGQLHILDSAGNELHRLDLPASRGGGINGGLGAPTLANIDGDADLELVIGTRRSGVVAYDLPGTAQAKVIWGTGRGNFRRTALAGNPNDFFLSALPAFRTIQPGQTTTVQLRLRADAAFSGTIQLSATDPGPLADIQLSPTTLTPPANATLTITDLRPSGQLRPGVWYTIPVKAQSSTATRTFNVLVLVGGYSSRIPMVRSP